MAMKHQKNGKNQRGSKKSCILYKDQWNQTSTKIENRENEQTQTMISTNESAVSTVSVI